MQTEEFIPTRQSLLSRLKDWNDDESWRRFFDTYWKLIYSIALKAGLDEAEAQDVVQETVLSVARRMGDFQYNPSNGSFKNWLLVITKRRIADQRRKNSRQPLKAEPQSYEAGPDALEQVPAPDGPDLGAFWDAEWEKNLFDAALERVRRAVDPKQFLIFDAYVLKQWPVSDVRKTLGVSATQAYLAKHRLTSLIKKEVKKLEREFM